MKIIAYIVLFILGVKFYFWGRKQQKKHAPNWGWRLTVLFFLAPLIIFFIDTFLPVPKTWIHVLKIIIKYMDYPVDWIYQQVKFKFGWWAIFVKPAIAAVFYGSIGFILGSMFDSFRKKQPTEEE